MPKLAGALVPALTLVLGACVSVEPRPLDPDELAAHWQGVDPSAATAAVSGFVIEGRESAVVPAAQGTFSLEDGITLAEAEVTALFFNPAIRVTRMRLDAARTGLQYAALWEDPDLDIDGEYVLKDVPHPLRLGSGLGVTIPLSGRQETRRLLANARLGAAEAAVLGAEWALVTTVRQAWTELVELDARIRLLNAAIAELQDLIDLAPSFRAAQAVTLVDERRLQIHQRMAQEELLKTRSEAAARRRALRQTLGLHPAHDWFFKPTLQELLALGQKPGRGMPAAHPAVAEVMAAYLVAEAALQDEVRKQYPDVRIGLGLGSEDGGSLVQFGLGLLPLPVWNANREGIAGADVDRTIAGIEAGAALQELLHRQHATRHRLVEARARLAFVETELAPLTTRQVEDVRRLVSLGQLDLALFAEALEQVQTVRLQTLEARMAVVEATLEAVELAGPAVKGDRDEE